jgi:hypothetical protein
LTFPQQQFALSRCEERFFLIGNGVKGEAFLSGGDIFQEERVVILFDELGGLIDELDLFLEQLICGSFHELRA